MSRRDELSQAIEELGKVGGTLFGTAAKAEELAIIALGAAYQNWYSKALPVIKVLASDRLQEFISYYERDPKRKTLDALTYSIQDFVSGIGAPQGYGGKPQFSANGVVAMRILSQVQILKSLQARVDSIYSNIEATIASEIYDRELAGARTLLKVSPRAAGVIAGVVLEEHLQSVVNNHGIGLRKKNPTLSELNDILKDSGVYDIPTWRKMQFLADIRNLCAHKKSSDPDSEQVRELIDGVDNILKTVH